ncbi:Uncharacterised protein [Yersinia aldovae]|uniref:hypothetical protein n=1 Tax=Yersinia aldovae TaxID=29483 RepID=UPI0005E0B5DE|nr:hypothetical protein [Yersinia aldovae]CNI21573.1 Uncharacterised protein [Yersinia aldovae]
MNTIDYEKVTLNILIKSKNSFLSAGLERILIDISGALGVQLNFISSNTSLSKTKAHLVFFDDFIYFISLRYSQYIQSNNGERKYCQMTSTQFIMLSQLDKLSFDNVPRCLSRDSLPANTGSESRERHLYILHGIILKIKNNLLSMSGLNYSRECSSCPFNFLSSSDVWLIYLVSLAISNGLMCSLMNISSKTLSYRKCRITKTLGLNKNLYLYMFSINVN